MITEKNDSLPENIIMFIIKKINQFLSDLILLLSQRMTLETYIYSIIFFVQLTVVPRNEFLLKVKACRQQHRIYLGTKDRKIITSKER